MSRARWARHPAVLSAMKGGEPAWTPAQFTGVVGLWRSTEGITLADTDKATNWTDLSAAGNDLENGVTRPTYSASGGLDSYPMLSFDGTNDEMRLAFALSRPVTVLVVARLNTWVNNDVMFDGFNANRLMFQCTGSSPNMRAFSGGAFAETVPVGDWMAARIFFDGDNTASSRSRVNNQAESTGDVGNAATAGGIRFGRRLSGNAAHMDLMEAVVLNQEIDAAEEVLWRSYLNARYPSLGLT